MKSEEKILTYAQARELKWFCQNITGTKLEFYKLLEEVEKYKAKIDRLQNTADMILEYCKEKGIKMLGEEVEKS